MYVMVVKVKLDGREMRYASGSKKALMNVLYSWECHYGFDGVHFRLHDGSGWCTGSEEAHRFIQNWEGAGIIV